jgi:hypothetical protein
VNLSSNNLGVLVGTLGLVATLFFFESLRQLYQMDHLSIIQTMIAVMMGFVTAKWQVIWNWKFIKTRALTTRDNEMSLRRLSRSLQERAAAHGVS